MKPVTLNLASRPFRNNTLVGSFLTIVGVGLLAATVYNLYVYLGYGSAYARLQQEQAEDRAHISKLQVEERQLSEQVRSRNFRQTYERGKLASELVRKSAFSWTQLFNTLETVVPPDVVMTAIRPNISSDEIAIRIEGVAKNSGAFLSFQDRLQRNPLFTDVYPSSERRLNPNLPDITFLLTCDYLPQASQPAATVAGAGGPEGGPATPDAEGTPATGAPGTQGTPAAGTSAAAATPPAAEAEKSAAGAASPARDGGRTTLAQASIPVGRDGRPVEPPVAPVLAPGALFVPAQPPPAAPGDRKSGKRRPTEPAAPVKGGGVAQSASATDKPQATAAKSQALGTRPAAAGSPVVTAKPPAAAAKPPAATVKSPASEVKPSGAAPAPGAMSPAGAAPKSGTPVRTTADGRVWDPNVPRTMPAQQKAALAAQPKPPERPAMASRLDVPLSFAGAPAGDVYERLAEAHGVRFDIQPGVDRAAPVTLNLQGRKLEDALALVAGQTRHRVRKVADGVYQVDGAESGRDLAVPPVAEEPVSEETP